MPPGPRLPQIHACTRTLKMRPSRASRRTSYIRTYTGCMMMPAGHECMVLAPEHVVFFSNPRGSMQVPAILGYNSLHYTQVVAVLRSGRCMMISYSTEAPQSYHIVCGISLHFVQTSVPWVTPQPLRHVFTRHSDRNLVPACRCPTWSLRAACTCVRSVKYQL